MSRSLPATSQTEYNNKTVSVTKYANIKIVGEKEERQITWDTYQKIKNLPDGFSGMVEIKELGITLSRKQISKIEEKEGVLVTYKDFAKLPTETVMLDKNLEFINKNKVEIEREYEEYYVATCHFVTSKAGKQYYLAKNQIKRLVLMKRDDDGQSPHYVAGIWSYGIEK